MSTLRQRDDTVVLISVHPKHSQLRQQPYYTPASSSEDPILIEFDSRGASRTVEDVPLVGARLFADHQDQVRFAVGYDRQASLVAMRRATVKDDWDTFELPGFRDNNISVQGFTADNRAVTFIAVREGESLNALYSLGLTSKAIEKLYQHSKTDITEAVTDLESGAVAGVLVHGARPEHHWLDESSRTAQLYQMLGRRFSGQTVRITSTSEDGRKALLLVDSDTNPVTTNYTDFNYAALTSGAGCYGRNDPAPSYPQREFREPVSLVAAPLPATASVALCGTMCTSMPVRTCRVADAVGGALAGRGPPRHDGSASVGGSHSLCATRHPGRRRPHRRSSAAPPRAPPSR